MTTVDRAKLLERAENAKRESRYLDFKRELDVSSQAAWCEVVKDIVAFANSGGGVIVFGVNNDGTNSGIDVSKILHVDVADITNKIYSYTNHQFSDVEILEIKRDGVEIAAILVAAVDLPMVFTKSGDYMTASGKSKSAFARGTVYFRHGAKSEPGDRDDLAKWRDDTLERIRKSWLSGIQKVVEAPAGHAITVVSSPISFKAPAPTMQGMAITAKVSSGPGAVRFVPQNAEELWPYRQKDLLHEINNELKVSPVVNGHDILCINTHLQVLKRHPEFAYKPHTLASPQYSKAYAEWITGQFKQDSKFFQRMRLEHKKLTAHK